MPDAIRLPANHRSAARDMRASTRRICLVLVHVCFVTGVAESQGAARDSAFLVGQCPLRTDSLVNWDSVASHVDRQASLLPASLPLFPMGLRSTVGNSGRLVLSMVVDTLGHVAPGSVSVEESTDARLSAWGCIVALTIRYLPAMSAGRPVSALTEQALSYNIIGAGRP
jgi:hypothetical protein